MHIHMNYFKFLVYSFYYLPVSYLCLFLLISFFLSFFFFFGYESLSSFFFFEMKIFHLLPNNENIMLRNAGCLFWIFFLVLIY